MKNRSFFLWFLSLLLLPQSLPGCGNGTPAELAQAEQEIQKKDFLAASNLLRKAIQKAPTHEQVHQKLRFCFQEIEKLSKQAIQEKKWKEARNYLENIFPFTEKDPIFYVHYAMALLAEPPRLESESSKDQDLAIRSLTTYYTFLEQETFPQEPLINNILNLLEKKLSEKPYSTESVYSTGYFNQDLDYLMESYLYQRIAQKIVHNVTSEQEKVFQVLSWVFHQVMGNVPEGKKEFAIKPKGVAFRGYGLSESSAYLFITLLQQLKIPAQLVQLRKKEGTQITTVAALTRVYLQQEWFLFDTLAGVPLLKPDGTLLSYNEWKQNPAILDQIRYNHRPYYFSSHSFDQIQPLMVIPPRSFFPKMREFQKILDQVQGPVLFFDIAQELQRSGLNEKEWNPQETDLSLWNFPFELVKESRDPKYLEERDQEMKNVYLFFQARILQVLGEFQSAETHYKEYLNNPQFEISEDFLFFRALNLWEGAQPQEALQQFQKYLEQYPQGCWKPKAQFYLGILLFPQSPENAKTYLQQIPLPLQYHLHWKYPQFFQ